MKTYILLGILLLAGVSFALTPNWMMYSADKYGCNYYYYGKGWDGGTGLSDIANKYYEQCDGGCWDTDVLSSNLEDMSWAVWDEGPYGACMCENSGCWESEGTSVSGFRTHMLEFNAAAAGYKAEFMAGLRAFIAEGGSRADILADMGTAKNDHLACLAYMREHGPCDMCE